MEMSLESALSTGGMVGHLSFLLLVISMMMRDMAWLRIFVILSACVAILYDLLWLQDPVGVFWQSVLVLVNIIQIGIMWINDHRASFSPEERALIAARLAGLSPGEARRLLDLGEWVQAPPGMELTREREPVTHLVYISSGTVQVEYDGRPVGICQAGNFVGEMSLVGDTMASATTTVTQSALCWQIETGMIRALRTSDPGLANALESGITQDLKAKVQSLNKLPSPA